MQSSQYQECIRLTKIKCYEWLDIWLDVNINEQVWNSVYYTFYFSLKSINQS